MLNFVRIVSRCNKKDIDGVKRDVCEISPKFVAKKSSDLMIRGGDFYAIWDERSGVWSTDEETVFELIDNELDEYAKEKKDEHKCINYLWDCDSGSIDKWHKYCQKQMRDNYHILDQSLKFSNSEIKKTDYSSKSLPYALQEGPYDAYDELMSVLYSDEERHKIEWAIGSIVNGASKDIQKFMVLYGSAGTGKSTILNIIQKLFEGYWTAFDAKSIGNGKSAFALEPFKTFPLVAIQHDGDLSRIEDNTKLNSLVSHEEQPMNAKYEKLYVARINAFLFMGTNKPVKITDAKSGILRRLIDVSPTGNKVKPKDYRRLMKQIDFELGAIAWHCKEVFEANPGYYDNYIPTNMMGASNDFYNFIIDSATVFETKEGVTLKTAWELYKAYAEDANLTYPLTKTRFKEELKNYFEEFYESKRMDDGSRARNYYETFAPEKFESNRNTDISVKESDWLDLKEQKSLFDSNCQDYPAQYANSNEHPKSTWSRCKTTLKDLDTSEIHYVRVPEKHIVIDFDIKNEKGEKDFSLNRKAANKWPKTYAEVSKGGNGIHLHYIYDGDVTELNRIYDTDIEIKVFTGKSSLRRRLSLCNDISIAHISSGLPKKGEKKKVIDKKVVQNEKKLIELIKRALDKDIHDSTKPNIDFINHILNEAYANGVIYDVSSLRPAVIQYAAQSTHQSKYCLSVVADMKFKSDKYTEDEGFDASVDNIIFFDIEIFPNLFLVCWKLPGNHPVVRMLNPSAEEIENLMSKYKLVGFNNRKYDNHLMYARGMRGYSVKELYNLSKQIINEHTGYFREAYGASYCDIFDMCSKKQSLKKWEIELGEVHKELGIPWDKPVDEKDWDLVAEYCENDVKATEAVWNARQADFLAREILVSIVKSLHGINACVNDTTNTLSTKIIFGNNRNPQKSFNYRDLSKPVGSEQYSEYFDKFGKDYNFRVFNTEGLPEYRDYIPGEELPEGYSILPFFPGYKFDKYSPGAKSTYLGEDIGEGGKVYSEPGMYGNVWDGDVSSMHPHSIIFEALFGPEYTKRFKDLVDARVAIKHHDFKAASEMLNGALKPYLIEEQADNLAYALKIVINSVYGLTSAQFENPFRDERNIDNIVAKRGALFMTLLKREVERRIYKVCHIKTDSIKIPDARQEIKDFVIKFGKEYGYSFETEAEFEKYCLINDAVYVAKTKEGKWIAVGKEFQVPYVFKSLFTHEPIEFKDMCETFAVSKGEIYLDMNEKFPDFDKVEVWEKELERKAKRVKDYETGNDKNLPKSFNYEQTKAEVSQLKERLEDAHNYIFVGRVGQFTPIQFGNNAGGLFRIHEGKAYATPGSKGYRWLESSVVKDNPKLIKAIDKSYYEKLVNEAVDDISQFGDYEWFVSDDPYVQPLDIHSDELPF